MFGIIIDSLGFVRGEGRLGLGETGGLVGVCCCCSEGKGESALRERRSSGGKAVAAEGEEEGEVELEVSVAMRRSGLTRDGRGDCYLLSLAVLFLLRTACAQCNPASLQHVHANFDVADLACESSGFHAEAWVCLSSSPLSPPSLLSLSLSLSHTHTHTHTNRSYPHLFIVIWSFGSTCTDDTNRPLNQIVHCE